MSPARRFVVRNLSVLNYAQGFTLWHYRSNYPMADVTAPAFFDDAGDMFAAGDIVMLTVADGIGMRGVQAVKPAVILTPLI